MICDLSIFFFKKKTISVELSLIFLALGFALSLNNDRLCYKLTQNDCAGYSRPHQIWILGTILTFASSYLYVSTVYTLHVELHSSVIIRQINEFISKPTKNYKMFLEAISLFSVEIVKSFCYILILPSVFYNFIE